MLHDSPRRFDTPTHRFGGAPTIAIPMCLLTFWGCVETPETDVSIASSKYGIISDEIVGTIVESDGPYTDNVIKVDYEIGEATVDSLVRSDEATDVRGNIHLPNGEGPFPLLVFLHGNHSNCRNETPLPDGGPWVDHTKEFPCPKGYIEAPSWEGYDYIGEHLASHGYVVVSINANRAFAGEFSSRIVDQGRHVLKHLAILRKLTEGTVPFEGFYPDIDGEENPETPPADLLVGKLDFRHVGLLGHSRGGEAVRAAHYLYSEDVPNTYAAELRDFTEPSDDPDAGPNTYDMTIEAIFEFAPVDLAADKQDIEALYDAGASDTDSEPVDTSGQGDSDTIPELVLDAPGVHRTVVLGTCDNDVARYDGVGPFSRRRMRDNHSRTFSSVLAVPGANHNYFNEEWTMLEGRTTECPAGQPYLWTQADGDFKKISGSATQRHIGLITASAFFRGFVGNAPGRSQLQKVFDPQYHPPARLTEYIDDETNEVDTSITVPVVRESLWHQSTEIFDGTLGVKSADVTAVDYMERVDTSPVTGMARQLTRIEWNPQPWEQSLELDLFGAGRYLDDTWILSFSVARYQEDETPVSDELDFGVALKYESDVIDDPVRVGDYVALQGGINEIISLDNQERFLLFHETPIELRDFDLADQVEDGNIYDAKATGLRFTFDPYTSGNIFVDNAVVIRKHPLLGDVNQDWTVTIIDALLVAQYYVDLVPADPYFDVTQADTNCDGTISIIDALLIARYYVGLIDTFPCQQ